MKLTPTQEQQAILDSFKEQLNFYQQVYTIQTFKHLNNQNEWRGINLWLIRNKLKALKWAFFFC